jgi:anaerobic magnesium-protoporphyrin IX monomethyl ester cyclase
MGLLYLARKLENDGDDVTIIDFTAEPYEEKKLMAAIENTDLVGLTVLSVSIKQTKKIIEKIKGKKPHLPIVIGGPHCTLFPKRALEETQADISVQGPGEKTILEIKKELQQKQQLSQVRGICYRTKKTIKEGLPREDIDDLDSIPFPSRQLVKKYTYGIGYNPNFKKGEFTSIITSRGCPFSCRFCSRGSISMKKYMTRSTEDILEEIREIVKMGFRYVAFVDDCFLADKKQVNEIFESIIKENIQLKFYITAARADSADEKLYRKLKQAGVVFIQFGLESGNQDVLDFYKKNTSVEQIKYAVTLSNTVGFYTVGSFIFGAPFETEQHLKNTITFAKTLPLVSVSFVPLKYMAGSELWYDAVEKGLIAPEEYVVSADKQRGLGLFTKKELIRFSRKAHREFCLRLSFIVNFVVLSFKMTDFSFLLSYVSYYVSSVFRKKEVAI